MWIMFWVIFGVESVTSGSQEFTNQASCDKSVIAMKNNTIATYRGMDAWCVKK